MYCSHCGSHNDDNNFRCIQCGQIIQSVGGGGGGGAPLSGAGPYGAAPPHVPNYMVPSILATIFCCQPLGIAAIVFAAQVDGKVSSGDIDGALHASSRAKTFLWLAFGSGLAIILIYVVMMVFVVADAQSGYDDDDYYEPSYDDGYYDD